VLGSAKLTRDELILENRDMVRIIAKQTFRNLPHHVILLEDLYQEGMIGLIQAADRYDASKPVKFKTFAGTRVRGAMLDYLRRLDHVPRRVRQAGCESTVVSIAGLSEVDSQRYCVSGWPSPLTVLMAGEMNAFSKHKVHP